MLGPDEPFELAKRWFRIAVWLAALPPALAALGLATAAAAERKAGQINVNEFIFWLLFNEAFTVLPLLLYVRWLRQTLVSTLGHDLKLLEAVMAGAIVGMLGPYVFIWGEVASFGFTWSGEKFDWGGFGQVYVAFPGLAGAAMTITSVVGGLVGLGIGKIVK
jgi:hypothetical protein